MHILTLKYLSKNIFRLSNFLVRTCSGVEISQHERIFALRYACIIVLKPSVVQYCSSSRVVIKNVTRHYDIDVQACSCVEISEHKQDPKLEFSVTAYWGLKISQFVSIQGLISCRTSVFWR